MVVSAQFRFAEVDDYLLDLAGELERHVIVCTHRRSGVFTDIETFVERETTRDRLFDAGLSDLLAVHREGSCSALADSAAIVLEVQNNGVLAGRGASAMQFGCGPCLRSCSGKQACLIEIQGPAAEEPALGDDHALVAGLLDHDFCRETPGLVLDIRQGAFGNACVAGVIGEGGPSGNEAGTNAAAQALHLVVVERQHVIL